MKINPLNSSVSFGKIPVAEFNVERRSAQGIRENIPVVVSRLEEKDYDEYFTEERTKKISMFRFFNHKKPDSRNNETYIITNKRSDELLGAADCYNQGDIMDLSIIGTSTNKEYHGLGKALLAGIIKDISGKLKSMHVPVVLDNAFLFYKKCHFDYNYVEDEFILYEDKFQTLIDDANRE